MNYDNFFLGADNLGEAKSYYSDILGLELKFDFSDRGMLAFRVGDEEAAIILKDKRVFPNMKPTIWFTVEDVKVEYEKLSAKGIVFLSEPFEIGTGIAAEFDDPFGNRLGITDYSKLQGNTIQ